MIGWRWSQLSIFLLFMHFQSISSQLSTPVKFDPLVSVSCEDFPYMNVRVTFSEPFFGIVHAVDHRTEFCEVIGNGGKNVTLRLNSVAENNAIDGCGVKEDEVSGVRSGWIVVRQHKTLEQAEDKTFPVSCNSSGYTNSMNERSVITMHFNDGEDNTNKLIFGRNYSLRVEQTKPDSIHQLQVKRCFIYNGVSKDEVDLTDSRGCPLESDIMSSFSYNQQSGIAQAELYSMIKLPGSPSVNVNCLVSVCQLPNCAQEACTVSKNIGSNSMIGSHLMITASATVIDPTESMLAMVDCSINHWMWLLGLCITFGVLFLIMLIVNILLCSALKCSCAKQEVIERDGSVIEDYDPYKGSNVGWSSADGSFYGSRYSLNSKHEYPGSTIDYSTLGRTNGRFQEDEVSSRSRSRQSQNFPGHI